MPLRTHKNFNFIVFWLFSYAVIILIAGCEGQGRQSSENLLETASKASESTVTFDIPNPFTGYNAQMLRGPSWRDPGFSTRVKDLHPGVIRYPGGTVASYWDWKTGWLKKDVPLKPAWKNIPENPVKLEDLKFGCEQTGAEPLFVLNMMTSNLTYQLEMLKHAESIGLPVKFVELDNELYLGEEFYSNKFPNGSDYGKVANEWIESIHRQFPGVKIAVVGNAMREGQTKKENAFVQRRQNWNRDVLSAIHNAEAMTFHLYGGSGLKYLGKLIPSDEEDGEAKALQAAFEKPEAVSYVLSMPFHAWDYSNTYDYKLLPSGMKAWITEYNLFETEGVVSGTWTHGLYALLETLLLMENPKTEMACYHNLTTSAQFAAIFNDEDGFFKAVKKKPTAKFGFTAAGYCLSLCGQAFANGGKAVKLTFSDNSMLNAPRGKQYPALNGWKITGKGGARIVATNVSAKAMTVDFSTVVTNGSNYTILSAGARQQVATESDITRKSGIGNRITLPPYSALLVSGK